MFVNIVAFSATSVSVKYNPVVGVAFVATYQLSVFTNVTFVRLVHPLNADFPIFITLVGITILVRFVQLLNAKSPIVVMFSDRLIFVIVLPLKALSGIAFTSDGSATLVIFAFLNAFELKPLTLLLLYSFGKTIFSALTPDLTETRTFLHFL